MAKKRPPRGRPQAAKDSDGFEPAPNEVHEDPWADLVSPASAGAAAAAEEEAPAEPADEVAESSHAGVPDRPTEAPRERLSLRPDQPERQMVSLDKPGAQKKLSRKQKESLTEKWTGDNRARAIDGYFRSVFDVARREAGHGGSYMGSDTKKLLIGIPMFGGHGEPSASVGCLPMEFVIAQDVFPLAVIIQLVAKFGVGKSSLLAEFARWFDMAGGGSEINENETKFSPELYESFLGISAFERMILNRCSSVEDWQRAVTKGVSRHRRLMTGTKEEPGPGRVLPILLGVDSVMGKLSEESQEAILGERLDKDPDQRGKTGKGAASRSFPVEAQIIARYMRTIPQELDGWPFAIVLVNHLRIGKDDNGHDVRTKGGGEQTNFQESFELELKKLGGHKKTIQGLAFEGYPVAISCEKSSFGPGQRRIETRVIWWEVEDENGNWQQQTIWDWDWTTVKLLNQLRNNAGDSPRIRANLIDMDFHIACPKTGEIDNTAWSASLGMKEKDAVPWQELGQMIRRDHHLMDQLRKALRIRRRPILAGDYLEQLDKLAREMQ